MKKILLILSLYLLVCGSALAKTPLAEFEKVREIKFLQSTREDVKRILKDFKSDGRDSGYSQRFSTENFRIEIEYSNGEDCSEEDSEAIWNVTEWKVVRIEIYPRVLLKLEELNFDYSSFRKEKTYANVNNLFVYNHRDLGIAFEVKDNSENEEDLEDTEDEEFSEKPVYFEINQVEINSEIEKGFEIKRIFLLPNSASSSLLCDNESTEDYTAFYLNGSFFTVPLEERVYQPPGNPAPVIEKVIISSKEIIIGCNKTAENEGCEDSNRQISVESVATDRENDVLTYNYTVSAGEIVGSGAKVVWDLTGVAPGTYTITVGADDGCGICGPTKTETVVVKECADCAKEKPQTVEEKQTSDTEKQMTNTKTQPLTAKTQP